MAVSLFSLWLYRKQGKLLALLIAAVHPAATKKEIVLTCQPVFVAFYPWW